MSSATRQYLPHIINALSVASEHQDNVTNIVKRVEEDLKACGHPSNNVTQDVQRSLEVGVDLGLLGTAENDVYRLRFNPNARPPFGFPLSANANANVAGGEKSLVGRKGSKTDYDAEDLESQHTLNNDDESDYSVDEAELEIGRKFSPKTLRGVVPKNECPFSFCMQKFRMNKARRRREAARRGARSRSRSRRKRSRSRRRRR